MVAEMFCEWQSVFKEGQDRECFPSSRQDRRQELWAGMVMRCCKGSTASSVAIVRWSIERPFHHSLAMIKGGCTILKVGVGLATVAHKRTWRHAESTVHS